MVKGRTFREAKWRPFLQHAKRGQASIEFLMLVAFFILFLTPIVAVMFDLSGEKADETAVLQAHQLGRRLVDVADGVYIQGGASSKVEYLFFPVKLSDVAVGGGAEQKELTITVDTLNGPTDMVFMGIAPLRDGGMPLSERLGSGLRPVRIYNDPATGEVVIEHAN